MVTSTRQRYAWAMGRVWLVAAGFAIGLVAGAVGVALLYSYPKGITAVRSYCTKCGMYKEHSHQHAVLGGERRESTTSSMLTKLLALAPNDHEHVYTEPPAHVFPSTEAPEQGTQAFLTSNLLAHRLRQLDNIDQTPQYVMLLAEAMKADREKARAFMYKLLDPKRHYPADVITILDRDASWEDRWALVDAFDTAYQCTETPQQVTCTLQTNGKPTQVFELRADGMGRFSGPSYRSWKP
jgi:hypothetical protein